MLLVLGMVLALYQITSDDTAYADSPVHSLDVSLVPDELTARITQSQLGAVTFGGNVTIEKPQGVGRVAVSLSYESGRDWPVTIAPQSFEFINPGTKSFQFTIVVPPGTPVSSATVTVIAHAKSAAWEADESTSATVRVGQFFKMNFGTDADKYQAGDGLTVSGKLFINNSGNGEDSFRIEMENDPSAVSGFDVDEVVTMPPFTTLEVGFRIHIDEDFDVPFDGEVIKVIIKVTSITAESKGLQYYKTHPITLEIEGLQNSLEEDWPTYVGYGFAGTLAVVGVVLVIRRRRGKEEDGSSVEEKKE